jgi:hypothetical protein
MGPRKTPELGTGKEGVSASRALMKANASVEKHAPDVHKNELEITKALRIGYEPIENLTIYFRRFAPHTSIGSREDDSLEESLRNEATKMAAAIKQTVPGVTWDWLCKILSDEYTRIVAESEKNLEKNRRHFGSRGVPEVVRRKLTR